MSVLHASLPQPEEPAGTSVSNHLARTRLALAETEARYRFLFDLYPDATIVHDGETVLMANQAAAGLFGYDDASEFVGSPVIEIVVPEGRQAVRERIRRIIEEDFRTPIVQVRLQRRDGTPFEAESVAARIELDGRPTVHVIIRDLTERQRAAEELKASEERFRRVVEAAPFGMHFYQAEEGSGRLVLVGANPAADQILGSDNAGLLGLEMETAFPGLATTDVPTVCRRVARHGGVWHSGAIAYREGGITRTYEIHAFSTAPGTVAVAFQDVTQRRKAELELARYREHLEQLVEERTAELTAAHKEVNAIAAVVSRTVEARDPYTAGHQRRVATLAEAMARRLGFDEDAVESTLVAAELHDIGKVSVPSEILTKPARLSPLEYELVKEHPRIAYDILESAQLSGQVADLVLQHHERLDGSGYPQGLTADDILPGAKVLAVADVVEAMSSHRPYRPALGIEAALEEITTNRGQLFDGLCVDACVALFEDGFSLGEP